MPFILVTLSVELLSPMADRPATDVAPSSPPLTLISPASATHDAYGLANAVSSTFAATQNTWIPLFASTGRQYVETQLVLFRDAVESGCGHSQPAVGSFYCPVDRKTYVDLGVQGELLERIADSADLAQAFVLAHEIGHHIQALLGIEQLLPQHGAEQTRIELQADCLAGVALHSNAARRAFARGEIEQAMSAAVLVGALDSSDSLTHGSPAERVSSFRLGFESGQISTCGIAVRVPLDPP